VHPCYPPTHDRLAPSGGVLQNRVIHRTHDHNFLIHFFIKIPSPPPAAALPALPAVILDCFRELIHKVSHRLRRGASLMALFGAWKHSRRISRAEERIDDVSLRVAELENDVESILKTRKKDRAREMAQLRWDKPRDADPPLSAGNGIGSDPVSQRIRAKRDARRASLADLAAQPPGRDEEEE